MADITTSAFAGFTAGPGREPVDRTELARILVRGAADLHRSGELVLDDRRRRPLYFDGRFLTARDLINDQQYFLARQNDLGRAGGSGVVRGLMVAPSDGSATSIVIQAGHGVTPNGELVML